MTEKHILRLLHPTAYRDHKMGTRVIVITGNGFRRETELRAYIPDPVGHEPPNAYETRVKRYLDQQYGANNWKEPTRSLASLSAQKSLMDAKLNQSADGQLTRLQRRAARSLKKLDKLSRPKR